VAIITAILNTLIVLTCLFMIGLILIQKGKGGGLAGAFGGVGGSSAFGTKAGDVFTRVTMVVAGVWIVLSMILVILYNQGGTSAWGGGPAAAASSEKAPRTRGKSTPAAPGTTAAPTGSGPEAIPSTPDIPAPAPLPSK